MLSFIFQYALNPNAAEFVPRLITHETDERDR